MAWYYAEAGRRFGPVEEAEFRRLVGRGHIRADTLVWQAGMVNWQSFVAVARAEAAAAPPEQTPSEFCSQCARHFSTDDMVPFEGVWICTECKPLFFQRVREGAMPRGTLRGVGAGDALDGRRYAGFWIRAVAKTIDVVALSTVLVLLALVTFRAASGGGVVERTLVWLMSPVAAGIAIAYSVMFLGRFGATPGKMACGLVVVTGDGSPVSYARGAGRGLAEILSGLTTMGIGYLLAAFDVRKRALHDSVCNTRVVHKG